MTDLGVWQPLSPREVGDVFGAFQEPWWIAGGWAVDAFNGAPSREHGDIDVGVLRRDQLAVQALLRDWDLRAADPPGTLRPWVVGESLAPEVHDIWCRPSPDAAWGIQLMLDEEEDGEWVYRRHPAVRRPLQELVFQHDGLPYLVIDVQLLYKAGHRSPKNEADFDLCLPRLSADERDWLIDALEEAHPGHPWIERLQS